MTEKKITFRHCEITQDCSYGWTLENAKRFYTDWKSVKKVIYILHDKDYKEGTDELREPHVHMLLEFQYPTPIENIVGRAQKIGLPYDCITNNRIEKVKSWSDAVNYLTHRDEHKDWKHIYDKSEIKSNFDWELVAESSHQKKLLQKTDARKHEIVDLIDKSIIREYNIDEHMSMWEQVLYSDVISSAFRIYINREKKKVERKMDVMFVTGASGIGKDSYAHEFCRRMGYSVYVTNNNDRYPFDDYKGQDAVIWSDARDNFFKPQEIFNLLDNHWKAHQKARYSDINLDCKLFIITSIKPLEEWYKESLGNANEDRVQLYRRIGVYVKVTKKLVYTYLFDNQTNTYEYDRVFINSFGHNNDGINSADKRREFGNKFFSVFEDDTVDEQYIDEIEEQSDMEDYFHDGYSDIDDNLNSAE